MKQALIKKGQVIVEEVPAPILEEGAVLVRTAFSFISAGTEMSSVKQSQIKSLVERILKKPGEKLKRALQILKSQGIKGAYDKVAGRYIPTGYSLSGIVLDKGASVVDLSEGDLVACAGAGIANHAEIVVVPRNLVVKVPKGCSLKDASSVTLGAIAMQGVRRADPRLGEIVAVIGLGILGLLSVQMLKAAGCRVVGLDLDPARIELAKKLGADISFSASDPDLVPKIMAFADGYGVDASIITAATPSNVPVQQSMEITRKKGKVVVVGAVGLGLNRSPFYEKEIDFLISCSYGPGRYDPEYEILGRDYPYGYVRWTENRNMKCYLDMVAEGKIDVSAIVSKVYPIEDATYAFESLKSKESKPIGVVLDYHLNVDSPLKLEEISRKVEVKPLSKSGVLNIGIIGAGSFVRGVHLPNISRLSSLAQVWAVCQRTGSKAKEIANQYGAKYCTTDWQEVLKDPEVDVILIGTRHNLHAPLVMEALKQKKAVFVEKPLAISMEELNQLKELLKGDIPPLMVGFNRRFSPAIKEVKKAVKDRINPLIMVYRVNAGYLPKDHWTQGKEGGGRLVGEGCHMVDVFRFLSGSKIKDFQISHITPSTEYALKGDNFSLNITFENGDMGTLIYTALGGKELPKEYIEVHWDQKSAVVDDFKSLKFFNCSFKNWNNSEGDKGHLQEMESFLRWVKGEISPPMSLDEILDVTEVTIKARDCMEISPEK